MKLKTITLAVSTAFILSACGNTAPAEKAEEPAPAEEKTVVEEIKEEPVKEDPYTLSDVEVIPDGNIYYVEPVLKNNTDAEKSYVQIQFPAKDADGNKIGDAMANVNNLKAGDTWKFKAMLMTQTDGDVIFELDNPEISGF